MRSSGRLLLFLLAAGAVSVAMVAQQGAVTFKHFKPYKNGQWSQQTQTFRDGKPLAPIATEARCTGVFDSRSLDALTKMAGQAAPMCQTRVLADEERTAEHEQVCNIGLQQQTIHSIMRAVDDRTVSTEIRHTVGGQEVSFTRITSRYLGACPAGAAPPPVAAMPALAMPRLSAEQCAQMPAMRKEAADSMKECSSADMPDSERAGCRAVMQRVADQAKQLEAMCK